MIIKLNKNQFDYLNDSFFAEEIPKLKLKQVDKKNQFVIIEIDEYTADKIRDWAGEELQKKGFDFNYELTREGKLLEDLIDVFYIRC